jgi:hypothetical protein
MRKFILIVPLLFVSAGAYAGSSGSLTLAASETIEQIRPADKPAETTEPPARKKTVEPTKNAEPTKNVESTRTRKAARPAANPRSARKSGSISGRGRDTDEEEARRLGSKYGITW